MSGISSNMQGGGDVETSSSPSGNSYAQNSPSQLRQYQQQQQQQQQQQLIRRSYEGVNPAGNWTRPDPVARIDETIKRHEKSLQDREKTRREMEQLELRGCSFKPEISRGADKILKKKQQHELEAAGGGGTSAALQNYPPPPPSQAEISARLHSEAKQRSDHQTMLARQVNAARSADLTFTPSIAPKTNLLIKDREGNYKPIHERVADIQRCKTRMLLELQQGFEVDQGKHLTFAPKIDQKSRLLAQKRYESSGIGGAAAAAGGGGGGGEDVAASLDYSTNSLRFSATGGGGIGEVGGGGAMSMSVGDRLLDEGRRAARRMQKLAADYEREQMEEMVLKPVCSSKGGFNSQLAKKSIYVAASFDERQEMYKARVQQQAAARRKEEEDKGESWFKPNIGRSEQIAVAMMEAAAAAAADGGDESTAQAGGGGAGGAVETPEQLSYRLSQKDLVDKVILGIHAHPNTQ